jgi:uncharacterized SAM-binding protein YcdF (DUF218 family)
MPVFISKLLPIFVYPLGLACGLLLAALLLKSSGWRKASLTLAIVLLWVGGSHWAAMGLARSLESRYPPCPETARGEVILLLGGGTLPGEAPRSMVEVGGAGDRVLYAVKMFKLGQAPYILASGGKLDWSLQTRSAAQDMADLLELMGVPQEAIWLQGESRDTYEDATYSAAILNEKGLRHILLVTSAAHMPRAVPLFEAQGLEVTACPTDYTVTDREWHGFWHRDLRGLLLDLLPSAEDLALTTRMLKEHLGILVYNLRGWK